MKLEVGNRVLYRRSTKILIVFIDEGRTEFNYLGVSKHQDGLMTSAWYSESELSEIPKFKVGDVVVNGKGTEYTIVSMCDSAQEAYTMIAISNKNTLQADVGWFTKDGQVSYIDLNSIHNLIPNDG
jgi:NADPH-dependent curcumin reductase CurA